MQRLGDVDAVVVSPGHHFPSGVALSSARRRALVEWAVEGGRLVLEHDYDGHFRYDRHPTGALQALAPEHVAYVGSASALLAPDRTARVGDCPCPLRRASRQPAVHGRDRDVASDTARARRPRRERPPRQAPPAGSGRRRETLVRELGRRAPDLEIRGEPVGLFVSVALRDSSDEAVVLRAARERGIALDGVNEHAFEPQPPGLVLGFAATPEPTLARAVKALAAALV